MNEDTAGRELTAEFHRLTKHEPPFRVDLGEAIRAAENDGRRRRNRTLAMRGGATVLAIAASTALVIAWPGQPRASAPPAAVVPTDAAPTRTVPTPSPTTTRARPTTPASTVVTPTRPVGTTAPSHAGQPPTTATPTTPALDTMARLDRLARQVAGPSGGVVTVKTRDAIEKNVILSVKTERGTFEVAARVTAEAGVDMARAMCTDEGKLCTTQWSSASAGVWSRTYADEPGRESLLFVTAYPKAPALWLGVTNDDPSGAKPLGPTWPDVGITVSGLRQAEAESGLSEPVAGSTP